MFKCCTHKKIILKTTQAWPPGHWHCFSLCRHATPMATIYQQKKSNKGEKRPRHLCVLLCVGLPQGINYPAIHFLLPLPPALRAAAGVLEPVPAFSRAKAGLHPWQVGSLSQGPMERQTNHSHSHLWTIKHFSERLAQQLARANFLGSS